MSPDVLFAGGTVLTMDPRRPRASFVAVRDGMVLAVGGPEAAGVLPGPGTAVVDCRGQAILPGFHDAHCHLLASAAGTLSVDCGSSAVRSIRDIQALVRQAAAKKTAGAWVRGVGYNEFYLEEKRHPDRRDLDVVARNPVRIIHRSGHAAALNSLGLRELGIRAASEDPPGGVIERDDTGEPTGLLYGAVPFWNKGMPPVPEPEIRAGLRQVMGSLLAAGVTAVQDATVTNSHTQWRFFTDLDRAGEMPVRLIMMFGSDSVGDFTECGCAERPVEGHISLGAMKVIVDESSGDVSPDFRELRQAVLSGHVAGFQVALHAVEGRPLVAAIDAIAAVLEERPAPHRHRIEHCAVCLPPIVGRLARYGITVVTQPGFVFQNGERYLATVPRRDQPYLYPLRSFMEAGVAVAAGSDSPVGLVAPLVGIQAAVTRRGANGQLVAPGEAIPVAAALRLYTASAAAAASCEGQYGSISQGKGADFVILGRDPTACEPAELGSIAVRRTVVGGATVFES